MKTLARNRIVVSHNWWSEHRREIAISGLTGTTVALLLLISSTWFQRWESERVLREVPVQPNLISSIIKGAEQSAIGVFIQMALQVEETTFLALRDE